MCVCVPYAVRDGWMLSLIKIKGMDGPSVPLASTLCGTALSHRVIKQCCVYRDYVREAFKKVQKIGF